MGKSARTTLIVVQAVTKNNRPDTVRHQHIDTADRINANELTAPMREL
jgi:hypothetical protein